MRGPCILSSLMDKCKDTILVLGVGNTLLTDEAVGVRVVEALRDHPDSDALGLTLMDGGTMGLSLLIPMEDADALIVVDAAMLGQQPGAVEVFEGADMDHFLRHRGRSPHDIGLDDIMDGLRLREAVPEHRALVGIQPAVLTVGESLTVDVEAAVPMAVAAILELVATWKRT
ncbi:MAG: HyaD/HybD family hydrogenase maturation endopeptidase [Rhodospirillales bacterium]|nr:HyaD/HybD family hydrogenase maturation endopeptidase [Rhodospirillales bacterium]